MRGPAESRNIGAKVARGKWIVFLDDDDTFSDEHVYKILDVLPNEKNKVLYFNYKRTIENRDTSLFTLVESQLIDISNRNPTELFISNFIPIHAMVFSAELFSKHAFDAQLQSHEDWDFLISLLTLRAEFEWIDHGCDNAIVHIDASKTSRNQVAVKGLDYLSIYRKWPADNVSIEQARVNQLKRMGIKLDCLVL